MALRHRYNVGEKTTREAYAKAEEVFGKIGDILSKGDGRFIHGRQFTAADLTFSCLAAPFILASQEDVGSHLAISLPQMKEAPAWVAEKAKALRVSTGGKHAIRCMRKERGGKDSFRTKESRYDTAGRPWWSHKDVLVWIVWGALLTIPIIFLFLWQWVRSLNLVFPTSGSKSIFLPSKTGFETPCDFLCSAPFGWHGIGGPLPVSPAHRTLQAAMVREIWNPGGAGPKERCPAEARARR